MRQSLSSLQKIIISLEKINREMNKEEQVYKAELADRLKKGLTGEDAIRHYNEWMEAAGQSHLMVKINEKHHKCNRK